jgi:signal transduction histidine kinase
MRSPLRAMQGFAQILEEECPDCQHPPASDYLQRIRHAAIRQDRLLTDALNYNRVLREEAPLGPLEIVRLLHGMIETYPDHWALGTRSFTCSNACIAKTNTPAPASAWPSLKSASNE